MAHYVHFRVTFISSTRALGSAGIHAHSNVYYVGDCRIRKVCETEQIRSPTIRDNHRDPPRRPITAIRPCDLYGAWNPDENSIL